MDNNKLYAIGDKVQAEDGRIGVVIDSDRDPNSQTPTTSELVVVKFADGSTTSAAADKFKPISDKPFSHVGS
ncbi:hypothetical protein [Pantanalinema sp. GBBB05]|uniref:hypothetical protein n=1 Tax=Pantanalinema sp. GBBB05 TaxID=2604139 RepID=UPI001E175195|nr:hypothetical protein [Pantanalinema sp. GBBB05]